MALGAALVSAGCVQASESTQGIAHHAAAPARTVARRAPQRVAQNVVPGPPVAPSATASAVPPATPVAPPPVSPAPAAGPRILSLSATPAVVHGGQTVVWDVRTTPDVVSVDARVSLYALELQKESAGHFGLSFAVPSGVPWFFHGTYDLDVRAHSASGETAHRSVSLTFQ